MRAALYLRALVGVRWNPALRRFYERLRAAGKPAKIALVACMRKLLTVLNAWSGTSRPGACSSLDSQDSCYRMANQLRALMLAPAQLRLP